MCIAERTTNFELRIFDAVSKDYKITYFFCRATTVTNSKQFSRFHIKKFNLFRFRCRLQCTKNNVQIMKNTPITDQTKQTPCNRGSCNIITLISVNRSNKGETFSPWINNKGIIPELKSTKISKKLKKKCSDFPATSQRSTGIKRRDFWPHLDRLIDTKSAQKP